MPIVSLHDDDDSGKVIVSFPSRSVLQTTSSICQFLVHAKLAEHLLFMCDLIDKGVRKCDLINFRTGTNMPMSLKELCGFYECIETGVDQLYMYLGTTLPLPPSNVSTLVLEMKGFESVSFGDRYAQVARALRCMTPAMVEELAAYASKT